MPSPFVSDRPTVPAVMVLFASVDTPVFATIPAPKALRLAKAPVTPIT